MCVCLSSITNRRKLRLVSKHSYEELSVAFLVVTRIALSLRISKSMIIACNSVTLFPHQNTLLRCCYVFAMANGSAPHKKCSICEKWTYIFIDCFCCRGSEPEKSLKLKPNCLKGEVYFHILLKERESESPILCQHCVVPNKHSAMFCLLILSFLNLIWPWSRDVLDMSGYFHRTGLLLVDRDLEPYRLHPELRKFSPRLSVCSFTLIDKLQPLSNLSLWKFHVSKT